MPSGRTNNFPESGRGLGHVTRTIFGSTVGYPSDSLASCIYLSLAPMVFNSKDWNIKKTIKHVWKGRGVDCELGSVSAGQTAWIVGRRPTSVEKRISGFSRVSRHISQTPSTCVMNSWALELHGTHQEFPEPLEKVVGPSGRGVCSLDRTGPGDGTLLQVGTIPEVLPTVGLTSHVVLLHPVPRQRCPTITVLAVLANQTMRFLNSCWEHLRESASARSRHWRSCDVIFCCKSKRECSCVNDAATALPSMWIFVFIIFITKWFRYFKHVRSLNLFNLYTLHVCMLTEISCLYFYTFNSRTLEP